MYFDLSPHLYCFEKEKLPSAQNQHQGQQQFTVCLKTPSNVRNRFCFVGKTVKKERKKKGLFRNIWLLYQLTTYHPSRVAAIHVKHLLTA